MRGTAAAVIGLAACLAGPGLAAAAPAAKAAAPAKQAVKPPAKMPAKPAAAAVPAAASAPAAQGVLDETLTRELNQAFKKFVVPRFTVLPDDDLPPGVKAAAQAMQAEHLPRVRALMERWLREELQQPSPERAFHRMQARLANEFALWGRDSTGPDQDAALAQALQTPGMCRPVGNTSSELVMRLGWLRDLAPEVQRAAVKAEAELLARWGQTRAVSEEEPLAAEEALLQLRATGQAPQRPLLPVLAYRYLGETDETRLDPVVADPRLRCAMHQWAGANPAQFRAAMAMQVADMYGADRLRAAAPTSDDDSYPHLPNFLGIRGLVTVVGDVSPEGRVLRLKVVKRAVEVPGIRDARPFAHEGVLELATLAKAKAMTDWAQLTKPGAVTKVEREFEWSLSWR